MSTPFVLRPIATTLLVVAVILLGILGYRALPTAALPAVDFPTIQVTTLYPDASPEVVETSITAPLEHYLGQSTGLASMNSTSATGTSQITLQFALSRRIDVAAQDVQAEINAASGWMPVDQLPGPPTYRLVNPADTPVVILALTSETLPLHEVDDHAQTAIIQKLSQVPGVGAVTVEGGQNRAVRLKLNPAALAGLGLSLEDVRRAVVASTTDRPKGSLEGARQSFQVGASDQLLEGAHFRDVIVAYRNHAPAHLRDVGTAEDGVENTELAAWYDGRPAVILDVQRQPGANTLEVVDGVKALLPKLRLALPPALRFAAMEALQRRVAEEILKEPAVAAPSAWVGGNGSTMSNGNLFARCAPARGSRPTDVLDRVRTLPAVSNPMLLRSDVRGAEAVPGDHLQVRHGRRRPSAIVGQQGELQLERYGTRDVQVDDGVRAQSRHVVGHEGGPDARGDEVDGQHEFGRGLYEVRSEADLLAGRCQGLLE